MSILISRPVDSATHHMFYTYFVTRLLPTGPSWFGIKPWTKRPSGRTDIQVALSATILTPPNSPTDLKNAQPATRQVSPSAESTGRNAGTPPPPPPVELEAGRRPFGAFQQWWFGIQAIESMVGDWKPIGELQTEKICKVSNSISARIVGVVSFLPVIPRYSKYGRFPGTSGERVFTDGPYNISRSGFYQNATRDLRAVEDLLAVPTPMSALYKCTGFGGSKGCIKAEVCTEGEEQTCGEGQTQSSKEGSSKEPLKEEG